MDDKTKSKKKLSVVLGLSGVALAGGIAWILLGSGESSMLVSSDLMESDETSSESSEETIPNLELAATDQTTDGLRFVVNGNSFVATGQAAPETMAILEPLITLAYSTNGTNSIETNTELQPNPYDQSIAGLVQLMATNIEFGDIEITDTTVTLSGEAPSEEFKSKFADFLGPESGFDQEIVNNITVVDKGFSNIAIVHTDERPLLTAL